MPRLLIVIDEFAALVAELPDFVTGLVDIARRGRSLGVHLILATQRPAGVVSAEIKSNTNLRIALRVTDAGDSADVLEAPDAAQIAKSTPGRGYARLGHSSLIPFQSSRVGGRPRGEDAGAVVDIRAIAFADLGTPRAPTARPRRTSRCRPTSPRSSPRPARRAATSGIVAPPSPWLPATERAADAGRGRRRLPGSRCPRSTGWSLPFGLVDVPSEQRRDVRVVRRRRAAATSASSARPARAARPCCARSPAAIGRYLSPADVHVYGVDCGNNALLPLVAMPARRRRRHPRPARPDGPADRPAARGDRAAAAAARRGRLRRRGRAAGPRRGVRADAVHRGALRPLGGLLPGLRRPRRRPPRHGLAADHAGGRRRRHQGRHDRRPQPAGRADVHAVRRQAACCGWSTPPTSAPSG